MAKKQLVPRDPAASTQRTRHFIDVVASMLNPLIQAGTLTQQGPDQWGIAGLLYSGQGPPDAALGVPGDHYLDLDTGNLYKQT